MERHISHNAQRFIEVARSKLGVNLAYNEQSVAWVDGYIERNRQHLDGQRAGVRLECSVPSQPVLYRS